MRKRIASTTRSARRRHRLSGSWRPRMRTRRLTMVRTLTVFTYLLSIALYYAHRSSQARTKRRLKRKRSQMFHKMLARQQSNLQTRQMHQLRARKQLLSTYTKRQLLRTAQRLMSIRLQWPRPPSQSQLKRRMTSLQQTTKTSMTITSSKERRIQLSTDHFSSSIVIPPRANIRLINPAASRGVAQKPAQKSKALQFSESKSLLV